MFLQLRTWRELPSRIKCKTCSPVQLNLILEVHDGSIFTVAEEEMQETRKTWIFITTAVRILRHLRALERGGGIIKLECFLTQKNISHFESNCAFYLLQNRDLNPSPCRVGTLFPWIRTCWTTSIALGAGHARVHLRYEGPSACTSLLQQLQGFKGPRLESVRQFFRLPFKHGKSKLLQYGEFRNFSAWVRSTTASVV